MGRFPQALTHVNELFDEFEADPDFGIPFTKKATLETEARWLADVLINMELGTLISIVAENEGVIVGHSHVTIKQGYEKHRGELGISVRKGHRDQGIGFEIMKTAIDESRKAGLLLISLTVSSRNSRAIHVYEKLGFKQVGVIPKKLYRNGRFTDELSMTLEL